MHRWSSASLIPRYLSNGSLNPNRDQRPPAVGPGATPLSRRGLPRLERNKLADEAGGVLTPTAESLAAQIEEGSLTGSDDISILAPLGSNSVSKGAAICGGRQRSGLSPLGVHADNGDVSE